MIAKPEKSEQINRGDIKLRPIVTAGLPGFMKEDHGTPEAYRDRTRETYGNLPFVLTEKYDLNVSLSSEIINAQLEILNQRWADELPNKRHLTKYEGPVDCLNYFIGIFTDFRIGEQLTSRNRTSGIFFVPKGTGHHVYYLYQHLYCGLSEGHNDITRGLSQYIDPLLFSTEMKPLVIEVYDEKLNRQLINKSLEVLADNIAKEHIKALSEVSSYSGRWGILKDKPHIFFSNPKDGVKSEIDCVKKLFSIIPF